MASLHRIFSQTFFSTFLLLQSSARSYSFLTRLQAETVKWQLYSTAYHRLKTLLRHAELPSIRFHDLRHTFATHALTSGVDAKTLSTILGHTNASFTLDTYTHMTTDMHRKAATVMGRFLDEIM